MATSSIFANFFIKNKKDAETFVDALDKSSRYDVEKQSVIYEELTDPSAIKSLWAKRKADGSVSLEPKYFTSQNDTAANEGHKAFQKLRENAKQNGTAGMTPGEINKIIYEH